MILARHLIGHIHLHIHLIIFLVCHTTCYIISIFHWGYHSVRTAQTKAYQSPLPFSVHTISGSATCHLCHQPTLRKNELSHRRTQSQGISSYHIYPSNIKQFTQLRFTVIRHSHHIRSVIGVSCTCWSHGFAPFINHHINIVTKRDSFHFLRIPVSLSLSYMSLG